MAVSWSDYELNSPPVASEARVQASERVLGVPLPADYLAVARSEQGRAPSPATVTLADGSHTVFNHLLHFESSPESTSLIGVWQDLEDILPERVIPFAGDPGGNFFCFDYRNGAAQPPVVFWSHDDPQAPPQRVAASFSDLLERLADP